MLRQWTAGGPHWLFGNWDLVSCFGHYKIPELSVWQSLHSWDRPYQPFEYIDKSQIFALCVGPLALQPYRITRVAINCTAKLQHGAWKLPFYGCSQRGCGGLTPQGCNDTAFSRYDTYRDTWSRYDTYHDRNNKNSTCTFSYCYLISFPCSNAMACCKLGLEEFIIMKKCLFRFLFP